MVKYKDIGLYPADTPGIGKTVPGETYEFDKDQAKVADGMPNRFEKVKGPGRPPANTTGDEGKSQEGS